MSLTRYRNGRHWAVHDNAGRLVCLTVYKKGGLEVERRLEEQKRMPQQRDPLFIGYARLEEWLDVIDTSQPVFATPLIDPGREEGGMRIDRLLVMVEQIDTQRRVHYCRLRAAEITRCYGEPFDSDWQEREAAWHSLWAVVQEELLGYGLTLKRACVAHPRHFRFLEGQAGCVVFDRTTRRFTRRPVSEQEGGRTDAAPDTEPR